MPARDFYHNVVRAALIKDGWTITHDPYTLTFGPRGVFVDLAAEQPIAAEKQGRKIAVEIKSFLGASEIHDLEMAIGQYVFYRSLLARAEGDRQLFLAVPHTAFEGVLSEPVAKPAIDDAAIAILVFNATEEIIVKWIH
jgi:hypothetical protein